MKLLIFLIILAVMCAVDVAAMKKQGLTRELVPYLLLSSAAGLAAAAFFLSGGVSVIGLLMRILRVSE